MIYVLVGAVLVSNTLAGSLKEGDPCDRHGVPGTCTTARSCSTYSLLPEDPQVTICSGEGQEAIVCCTDCVKGHDTSKAVGRKSREKCLEYAAHLPYSCQGATVTARLELDDVNKCHRLEATPGKVNTQRNSSIPYMALLGYLDEKVGVLWSCHGSIISDRFVLTTAHCGADTVLNKVSQIAVGLDKRIAYSAAPPAHWQIYKVKQFLPHPSYEKPERYFDIGLVETEIPMKFSESVLPVCLLAEHSDADPAFVDVLGDDDETQQQEKVELKRLENAACSEKIPPSRHLKEGLTFQTQTCYDTFEETKKSCLGSSGRGIYLSGELPCMKYQLGVTAFGTTCRGGVTVYTRVFPYLDWIESTVWP